MLVSELSDLYLYSIYWFNNIHFFFFFISNHFFGKKTLSKICVQSSIEQKMFLIFILKMPFFSILVIPLLTNTLKK